MSFTKGKSGNPDGRPKGTPNKQKKELWELMRERFPNYHPVLAMTAIATNEENELNLRLMAHKEVAKYLCPQLKAVEQNIQFTETSPPIINIEMMSSHIPLANSENEVIM
jgi:hypothetical protein